MSSGRKTMHPRRNNRTASTLEAWGKDEKTCTGHAAALIVNIPLHLFILKKSACSSRLLVMCSNKIAKFMQFSSRFLWKLSQKFNKIVSEFTNYFFLVLFVLKLERGTPKRPRQAWPKRDSRKCSNSDTRELNY